LSPRYQSMASELRYQARGPNAPTKLTRARVVADREAMLPEVAVADALSSWMPCSRTAENRQETRINQLALFGAMAILVLFPTDVLGYGCLDNAECASGMRCYNCTCHPNDGCQCVEDGDCLSGEWCHRVSCECKGGEPANPSACPQDEEPIEDGSDGSDGGVSCTENSDCPNGYACMDGGFCDEVKGDGSDGGEELDGTDETGDESKKSGSGCGIGGRDQRTNGYFIVMSILLLWIFRPRAASRSGWRG
jgi:hypothetical protein